MRKTLFCFFICAILFSMISCGSKPHVEKDITSSGSTHYAKGFSIESIDDYKKIQVIDPKSGTIWATYYLVASDSICTPQDGVRVRVPLKSISITSATHTEFLVLLDQVATIDGACSPHLIYNELIREAYQAGRISNLGDDFNINVEVILKNHPDALLLSSFGQQDESIKRIESAGIPILYNNEWMEESALGRAEWIKFIAAFYKREEQGDSIFNQIVQAYNQVKELTAHIEKRPSVFVGSTFKGTWYVSGGNSYMGNLLADAHTDYLYAKDNSSGSLSLSFETALHSFVNADVWLNAPVATFTELYAMDKRHRLFKAAKNGEVYAFFARTKTGGANDFWESGVAHPDLVLKDLIWAVHPGILPDYQPTYILKLNP